MIRLVNQLISRAVETRASDIHLEPFEDRLRVRYRYDGVLHESETQPARMTAAITSRIKIMARLDIAERRLPQDGRIKLAVRGTEVDFRVSTIPSQLRRDRRPPRPGPQRRHLRLRQASASSPHVAARLDRSTRSPQRHRPRHRPYRQRQDDHPLRRPAPPSTPSPARSSPSRTRSNTSSTGVNQVQVKPQIGLDFATLLRSILRQDPDVIMVGEIRDLETAQIAVQAALTGHLGALHPPHQLRRRHRHPPARHGPRGLPDDRRPPRRPRPAPRPPPLRPLQCARPRRRPPPSWSPASSPADKQRKPVRLWHPTSAASTAATPASAAARPSPSSSSPTPEIERLIYARADASAEIEREATAQAGMVPMFDAGLRCRPRRPPRPSRRSCGASARKAEADARIPLPKP